MTRILTPADQNVWAGTPLARTPAQVAHPGISIKRPARFGDAGMKIEVQAISNGYLVILDVPAKPTSDDPLAQRQYSFHGTVFADTPEAVCGVIAEQVLKMSDSRRT